MTIQLLEQLLEEGLNSGESREWTRETAEDIKRKLRQDLEAGYRRMAADKAREAEALEWAESLLGDVADGSR